MAEAGLAAEVGAGGRRSPDGTEDWLNGIVRVRGGGEPVGTVQATVTDAGTRAEVAWVVGSSRSR